MVDYIINAVRRSTGGMLDDEEMDIRAAFSGWEWIVLNVCEVCLARVPVLESGCMRCMLPACQAHQCNWLCLPSPRRSSLAPCSEAAQITSTGRRWLGA